MSAKVRPGYKQTDVGVIPEDWGAKPLAGLVTILHGFGFQSQYFKPFGDYRLTTPGHFHETGGFRDVGDKQKFYDGPLPDGYLLSDGDLIVAMTEQADGLLGSAAMVPAGENYLHNQRLGKVRVLSPEVSVGFLYRVFNSPAYRAKVRETAAGTKVKHTSPSKLLEIRVALPPTRAEQEAIAEALSDADALIESLEQLIAKKRHFKQGTMQELLRPKDGWAWKTLGDLAGIQRGASPRPIDSPIWFDDNSSVGWVRISDVTRSAMYLRETTQRLSALGVQHSRPVSRGSLIMSICATVGRPIITEIDACIHDGFVVFDNLRADKHFMYYILTSIESDWSRHGQTGSQMNLNTGLIAGTRIAMPTPAEQTTIAAILSDMDAEIAALEARLAKARQVKQGMMQELLTGRIRLI